MTEGEKRLWSELKEFKKLYGLHIRRQAPIGPFVVDFVIHEKSIVIEVDGEHHFRPEQMEKDRKRDNWLRSQGYKIIRLNTGELSDSFGGCVEEILREADLM